MKKLNEAVRLSYPLFLMNLFYFCLEFRGSVWLSKFMWLLDGFSSPFLIGCERTSAQLNCDTVQDVTQLRQAMGKSGLHLVIGGKSLGKTKIAQTVVDNAGDEAPLLYVNMRLPSKAQSTDALECLQEEAKRRWTAKDLPFGAERLVAAGSAVLGALGKANLKKSDDEEIGEGAVETLLSLFLNITKPEEFIKAFVAATMAAEKVPVMIVDEANIAFPNGNGGNGNGRREAAYRALATFVALTKEQGKASVILFASDYDFPLGLQALGFNKYDALNTIVAPEVEEKPMLFFAARVGFVSRLGTGAMSNFAQCFSKPCFLLAHARAKQGRILVSFVWLNFLYNQFITGCMGRNCVRVTSCQIGTLQMILCCGLAGVL